MEIRFAKPKLRNIKGRIRRIMTRRKTGRLEENSGSCPPLEFRAFLSSCPIFHFTNSQINIKSAFLESAKSTREVVMISVVEVGLKAEWIQICDRTYCRGQECLG